MISVNPYEEWFISDYDCYVDGLYEKLGEYENLDELNYLASKLDELDDHDYNHFQAAMQISDYTGSIKDVINLIDNLDKYEIYPGVESNADLGHYYIEELGMMEVPDILLITLIMRLRQRCGHYEIGTVYRLWICERYTGIFY